MTEQTMDKGCPFSTPLQGADFLRICQFGGQCGYEGWHNHYQNCVEYKRGKKKLERALKGRS